MWLESRVRDESLYQRKDRTVLHHGKHRPQQILLGEWIPSITDLQLPIHLFQHVHTPLSKNNAGLLLHLQQASTNPDAWLVDACIGRPTLQLGCHEGHQQQGHQIFTRFVETQQSLYRQQQVRVWSHWSHMATGMKDLVSGLKAKKWQLSDFGLWKVRSKVRHLEFVESMCLFRDTSKGLKFWQDILFT